MSVCLHGRVGKLLKTELVAEYCWKLNWWQNIMRIRKVAKSDQELRRLPVWRSVRPSIHTNSAPAGWTTVKFRAIYYRRYNLHFTWISMSIYEIIFFNYSWAENFSDKRCEEVLTYTIHVKNISLRKSYRLRNNYQKYDGARDVIGCKYTSCDAT
jgi:hypothetical protein